ncbi:MAG TPA: M48 family metalloprotease [bacterium]|nr:M48 family metalloprotease [bacterium]
MLIPFLPYLLAVAGLSALLALPPMVVDTPGWALAALFVALPLVGAIVGELPTRWLGGRYGSNLRRRMLFLSGWLALLALVPMAPVLQAHLGWTGDGESAALMVLLLNYWVGDALAVSPLNPLDHADRPEQLRRFGHALRMPLPILLLMLAGLALPVLSDDLLIAPAGQSWMLTWLRVLGGLGTLLLLAAVAVPVLIRFCWGLRTLPEGPAAQAMRQELAANGVSVGAVLAWPDELMGHATAGVIGLLPRFRYLMISPSLIAALDPTELRAVTAHEAGHIKHRHLWYFLVAIAAFILVMQVLATGLFWAGLFTGGQPPMWLIIALEVMALLVFFRFGVGYVSRHFERQADSNALRRLGPQPFEHAIAKVALINGIPPELDNWHHYGIGRRIRFAQSAHAEPKRLVRHDRKVTRIKLGLIVLLVAGLGAQAAASSPGAMSWLGERYLAHRLNGDAVPTRAELLPLQFLASRAVQHDDTASAEHYFRLILRVTPKDPQALNNLAWVLVTRPQARPQDLREGLRLAEQASETGDQAYIWDTLAESYYRLGRYNSAVAAASKALLLAKEGTGRGDVPISYYQERLAAFARHGQGA